MSCPNFTKINVNEDIKKSLEQHFIYRLTKKEKIQIFNNEKGLQYPWLDFENYKNKVWINGKNVELDNSGLTVDEFETGEYRVYIEDIDKITNTNSMFWNCHDLVSAFIPIPKVAKLINSGNFIFGNCNNLKEVSIPSSITYIEDGAFFNCSRLASVNIGDSVTSIGKSAFCGCAGLTSVTIPNSVTTINYRAFENCGSLADVVIGDSVTSIGGFAFSGCRRLVSVTIPDSVTSIGRYAFDGCKGLTNLTIGNSVTFIGHHAFYGCRKLKTIYVEDINKFNQIKFEDETADPRYYGAQIVELKK